MPRKQRLVLLGLALAVAVAAVIVLGTGGDEKQRQATTSPTTTQAAPDTTASENDTQTTEAEPPVERIEVKGGRPEGGVARISVAMGDTVRIDVRADAADEIHVHGYDLARPVGPGTTARLRFPAKLEGVFEIELHSTHTQIAQLRVEP